MILIFLESTEVCNSESVHLVSQIFNNALFIGGDPEIVRASQKARFADVKLVDEILELDAIARKGKLLCFMR